MPHASEAMARYRVLEGDLRLIRAEQSMGSLAEDPILEEMARVWWLLSDIEREMLDREGPTCDPETIDSTDDLDLVDRDTLSDDQVGGPRRARSG
jgi:hypothetical protein